MKSMWTCFCTLLTSANNSLFTVAETALGCGVRPQVCMYVRLRACVKKVDFKKPSITRRCMRYLEGRISLWMLGSTASPSSSPVAVEVDVDDDCLRYYDCVPSKKTEFFFTKSRSKSIMSIANDKKLRLDRAQVTWVRAAHAVPAVPEEKGCQKDCSNRTCEP